MVVTQVQRRRAHEAQRRLGGLPWLGCGRQRPRTFPPTPAMKRFADSIARQKGSIKPARLQDVDLDLSKISQRTRAQESAEGETPARPKPVSPAQMLYAIKVAQAKGIVIPHEAKADLTAMSAWIDWNRSAAASVVDRPRLAGGQLRSIDYANKQVAENIKAAIAAAASLAPVQPNSVTVTPLRDLLAARCRFEAWSRRLRRVCPAGS